MTWNDAIHKMMLSKEDWRMPKDTTRAEPAPKKRKCKYCKNKLSMYNPNDFCFNQTCRTSHYEWMMKDDVIRVEKRAVIHRRVQVEAKKRKER